VDLDFSSKKTLLRSGKGRRGKKENEKVLYFSFFFLFFFMFPCDKFFLIHMRCPASLYATYLKIIIIIIIY